MARPSIKQWCVTLIEWLGSRFPFLTLPPPLGRPSIRRVSPREEARPWGREIFLVETDDYIAKRLIYRAGSAGGLQYHKNKEETFLITSGHGIFEYDDGTGQLAKAFAETGDMFHIPPGAPHKFTALDEVTGLEWSNTVYNDRVRCEEEYGRVFDGGLHTT